MKQYTDRELKRFLLGIMTPDVLNIPRFAPNYRGKAMIEHIRVDVKVYQDFSHYGYRVYDWYMLIELTDTRGDYPNWESRSIRLTDKYRHNRFGRINLKRDTKSVLRLLHLMLRQAPLQECNGIVCRKYRKS